jgi:hypothetical protein
MLLNIQNCNPQIVMSKERMIDLEINIESDMCFWGTESRPSQAQSGAVSQLRSALPLCRIGVSVDLHNWRNNSFFHQLHRLIKQNYG